MNEYIRNIYCNFEQYFKLHDNIQAEINWISNHTWLTGDIIDDLDNLYGESEEIMYMTIQYNGYFTKK